MTKCTWVDCENEATKSQIGKDGSVWANLCESHNGMIENAIVNSDAKAILSYWVKAQGGAKKAASRILDRDEHIAYCRLALKLWPRARRDY